MLVACFSTAQPYLVSTDISPICWGEEGTQWHLDKGSIAQLFPPHMHPNEAPSTTSARIMSHIRLPCYQCRTNPRPTRIIVLSAFPFAVFPAFSNLPNGALAQSTPQEAIRESLISPMETPRMVRVPHVLPHDRLLFFLQARTRSAASGMTEARGRLLFSCLVPGFKWSPRIALFADDMCF